MIQFLSIASVSAEEKKEKCPLQKFGYGHTLYETKFYQRQCKYMLCRGNAESPSGAENKRRCWDMLERECRGELIPHHPIYTDSANAECPLIFYRLLNKKFLESDSMMLPGLTDNFVKTDISDTNFFKQDCERDRCCIKNTKGPNECWKKLLAEKKIITR